MQKSIDKSKSDNCPVFLINLDGSDERLASSRAQLDAAGRAFTRVPGVDGRNRPATFFKAYNEASAVGFFGRGLKSSEVGCYLSHVKAAQCFLDSGAEFGLVLEDDFSATPASFAQLQELVGDLSGPEAPEFELVNLARHPKLVLSKIGQLKSGDAPVTIYRSFYFPVIATALLWNRKGAENFLNAASDPIAPVDHIFRRLMCQNGQGLALDPPIFSTTGVSSDIHGPGGDDKSGRNLIGRRQFGEFRRQVVNICYAVCNKVRHLFTA